MKPEWWIQTNMDGVDTSEMVAEVRRQDMEAVPVEFSNLDPIRIPSTTAWPVVCYGDIDFIRYVRRYAPWVPGAFANFDNLKCSTYYAYLGKHLLNQDYRMMPLGELLRLGNKNTFPRMRGFSLFVRPDSGTKPFTGQIVERYDDAEQLLQQNSPEELIVVSTAKMIDKEWRFVICEGRVVTGCGYLPEENDTVPIGVWRFAQQIASESWQPDLCYTMDICQCGEDLFLLEINSLSCAGLYKCYMPNVVRAVSRAACNEWNEHYDSLI